MSITSARRPQDNRTYTEEETTYDSFGNELTCTDENGLVSQTSYDPESGEETETIRAAGTAYETKENEYRSADGLKTMTVDACGRVSTTIQDGFGSTILSKDEAAATKYGYDILGRMVQSEIPQEKENGSIRYRKTTTEYDTTGNVTEKSA